MLPAFVGIWKFEYDAAMRAHWQQHFRAKLANEPDVVAALATVTAEAAGAEIEVTADGKVASRSNGEEFYRSPLAMEGDSLAFTKPSGARIMLTLAGPVDIREDEPCYLEFLFGRVY
jgi:hypothetical protein